MHWFDVDECRDYLAHEGKRPSRKVVYRLVGDGLRVARTGKRIWTCAEWVDEFLEGAAERVGEVKR